MGLLSIAKRFREDISIKSEPTVELDNSEPIIRVVTLDKDISEEVSVENICPVLKVKLCYYNNCRYWNGMECSNSTNN